MRTCALLVVVAGALACPIGGAGLGDEGEGEAGEGEGEDYPEPNANLVLRFGSDTALEVGAYNVQNFPCGNSASSTVCRPQQASTAELLADVLYSLDVDLMAVEEITSVNAFQEVVDRLPHHEGVLSGHEYGDGTYQKIGFLYDARRLTLESSTELFSGSFNFPRPALEASFTYDDGANPALSFTAIAVHLKAGGAAEDRERRTGAIADLEGYVRGRVDGGGTDNIVMLGDFNQELEDAQDEAVWAPLLDPRYSVRTQSLADQGGVSYIPSGGMIDHLASTAEFDDAATTLGNQVPPLDDQISNYRDLLSDHLPVVTKVQPL